jgi:hypothetical protein
MVVASWNNDPYCSPIYLQCLRYWLSLSFPNYYYMKLRIIIYWYTYNNLLVYIQQYIVIHKIIYIYTIIIQFIYIQFLNCTFNNNNNYHMYTSYTYIYIHIFFWCRLLYIIYRYSCRPLSMFPQSILVISITDHL